MQTTSLVTIIVLAMLITIFGLANTGHPVLCTMVVFVLMCGVRGKNDTGDKVGDEDDMHICVGVCKSMKRKEDVEANDCNH